MQHTIQHLFRANSLEEVSRERLEELVTNYPSFSVGRYLLSRKLHAEQDGQFSQETQKTNLYFTNPFWLQWLLQNEQPATARALRGDEPRPEATVEAPATGTGTEPVGTDTGSAAAVEAPLNDGEEGNGIEPASGEIFFQEKLTVSEEAAPGEDVQATGTVGTGTLEGQEDSPKAGEETSPEAGQVEQKAVQAGALEAGTVETRTLEASPLETKETETGEPEGGIDPRVKELLEAVRGGMKESPETVETDADETEAEEETSGVTEEPPTAAEALMQRLAEARELRQTLVQMNKGEETALTGKEGTGPVADEPANEAAVADNGVQGPTSSGSIAQTDGETPTSPQQDPPTAIVAHAMALAEPVVEFEPYHTIDYFASVGIKFVQEENPSDKLGKQLKSFTDWLKVMRKLPQKNQEIVPDMAAEHQIQAIAAHSIKGKEVVTETMAEVLVKQGMREKAVEVYHKLSLLNPDKSAYFAAKIEQLKID